MAITTVACVIEHLGIGGEEKIVLDLLPALRDYGIRPCVITFMPGKQDQKLREKGVKLITLSVKPDILRIPALTAIFKKLRPDIVHTRLFSAGLWGRVGAHLAGVPSVIHTHGGFTFREKRLKRLPIERLFATLTDASICVSNAVKNHLIVDGKLIKKNLVVIPNGISVSRFLRTPPRVPQTPCRLITVGRLEHVKGQDLMIRALAVGSGYFKELWLVGDGADSESLHQLSSDLGVNHKVRFLGTRDDIPGLLAQADVYVAPSRSEGLPVAVLEAMASGLPVVATDIEGNREVLEGVGWLAEKENPFSLTQSIIAALQNPGRAKKMAIAGRDRVVNKYSLERMVRDHVSIYKSCLGGCPRMDSYRDRAKVLRARRQGQNGRRRSSSLR